MHSIPEGAPGQMHEAFSYIGGISSPTADDLRLMVLLEAAGETMYGAMADCLPDPEAAALLRASGRDERRHAQRVSEALGLLGIEYRVPAAAENPYLKDWRSPVVTIDLLDRLAMSEYGGEAMYEQWASQCPDPAAASLLRQNGAEETVHGDRLKKVVERMRQATAEAK